MSPTRRIAEARTQALQAIVYALIIGMLTLAAWVWRH